jgi:hypothetical protein
MVAEPGKYGCVAGADASLPTEPVQVSDNIAKEI